MHYSILSCFWHMLEVLPTAKMYICWHTCLSNISYLKYQKDIINTSFTILTHRTCSQARSWRGKCLDQGDELIISWLPDLMISVFHTWISVTVLKNNIAQNYGAAD